MRKPVKSTSYLAHIPRVQKMLANELLGSSWQEQSWHKADHSGGTVCGRGVEVASARMTAARPWNQALARCVEQFCEINERLQCGTNHTCLKVLFLLQNFKS